MRVVVFTFLVVLLASCGGGGESASVKSSFTMLDSFGNIVTQIGNVQVTSGDAGGDGVVSDGIPVANASVVVTDINGKTATATADTTGYYRARLTGFVSPLVFRATNPVNNVTRSSISTDPIVAGKFTNTNISGLSDKIASDVAVAGGQKSPLQLTPTLVKANSTVLETSIGNIANQFSTIIKNAGLNPTRFNPLNVPFRAENNGYNNVLHNTVVINSGAATTTQLLIAPEYISPGSSAPATLLAGTWTYTLTDPLRESTITQSGAYVPTSLNALVSASLNAWLAEYSTVKNSNVSITGNTVSFTQTISNTPATVTSDTSITFLSYVGCGDCGVGSTVRETWTWTQTNNGVNAGPFPTTAIFTRIN